MPDAPADEFLPFLCGNRPFGGPVADDPDAPLGAPVPGEGPPRSAPPDDEGQQRGAIADVKWPAGREVTVALLQPSSDPAVRWCWGLVEEAAREWARYANLDFRFEYGRGDITVACLGQFGVAPGQYSSFLGTDCLRYARQGQPSTRLGLRPSDPPDHARGTVLHELGHALGLVHEHQNPGRRFRWRPEAVAVYQRRWGWPEGQIRSQILGPAEARLLAWTTLDPDSVMMYPVLAGAAEDEFGAPFVVPPRHQLSDVDKAFIAEQYPGRSRPGGTGGTGSTGGTGGDPPPRAIALGAAVDDAVDRAGQRRRYRFELPGSGSVRVTASGAGPLAGRLFGPDSDTAEHSNLLRLDDGSVNALRYLDAGRWLLEIGFEGGRTGRFALRVVRE